jgi:hypothetical protein
MSDDVVREYHEALYLFNRRLSEELAALEHISNDDVRRAKAELAVPKEMADRLHVAVIAFERQRHDLQERWIAAHEDLAILRRSGIAP